MKQLLQPIQKKLMKLPKWVWSNWVMAAAFALITLLTLSEILFAHHSSFFVNLDNVDQFYTWYQKLAIALHHSYLPVWNANVYGGQSFAGELQPGVFYPLNVLWVLLFGSVHGISENALNFLVAIHFWFAAFGGYLLIKALGARKWAAFLAGLTFAFSGVLATRSSSQAVIFFGLTLLPYPLLFLVKYHNELKKRWLVWSGIFLGLLLLVGHIEPFFHALLALAIFEAAYIYKAYTGPRSLAGSGWKALKSLVLVGLIAGVVAGPQLWVSAPYLGNSYRVQADGYAGPGEKISYGEFAKSFNVNPHEFANLLDPVAYPIRDGNTLFIGLVPLLVILLTWYLARRQIQASELWKRHSFFVTSLLVISIVAMLGYVTWFAVVLYKLPFVYQIRQLARYEVLFGLGLAIMLAVTLPVIGELQLTRRQVRNILLAGTFLLIDSVYLYLLRKHIFGLSFALQTGLLALALLAIALCKDVFSRKIILGILVIATVLANTKWFVPVIGPTTETTAVYTKIPAKLIKTLEATNGQYRVQIDDNALPVNFGNVYDVQTTGGYSATIYAPYYRLTRLSGVNKNFVDDVLGVRLIATRQPPESMSPAYADTKQQVYVYVRPTALPKFFTTTHDGSVQRSDYHGLAVKTLHYDDHRQTFKVTNPKAQRVILSEIAYSGWKAQLDGKTVALQTYAIKGEPLLKEINLPAGNHTVELDYKPFGLF